MPNIIDRISNIIRANVNDLLDGAEDPEAMLNQIIRDMSDALRQADSDIADQIAQEKMIQGDLDAANKNKGAWQKNAELAVNKGRDDLAKQALVRVNDYTAQADLYGQQLDAQRKAVTELKSKRDELKTKYDSAVRNREMLVARAKRAQAESNMTHAANKANTADYGSELDRMERKIRQAEARNEAEAEVAGDKTSLDEQFDQLADDQQLDQQLEALKAQMGKS